VNNGIMMLAFAAGAVMLGAWFISRQNGAAAELPASQQQPESMPEGQPSLYRSRPQTGGAGTGYGIDEFGDEG